MKFGLSGLMSKLIRQYRLGLRGTIAAALGAAMSMTAGPGWAACKVAKIAELPVTMSGLFPLVPAKINGSDVRLAVGSAFRWSTINESVANQLKIPLPKTKVSILIDGRPSQVKEATVQSLILQNQTIPDLKFIVFEASREAAGVLGQDILSVADLEYDFANRALRLLKTDGDCTTTNLAYWARGSTYSVIDIEPTTFVKLFTVGDVYLDGKKMRAMLQSEGPSFVSKAAAARAGFKPDPSNRRAKSWIATFPSFKIGDEEIQNARLQVVDQEIDGADMMLGADFLLAHRVYVSNGLHRLFFSYNGGPVFDLTSPLRPPAGKAAGDGALNKADSGASPPP